MILNELGRVCRTGSGSLFFSYSRVQIQVFDGYLIIESTLGLMLTTVDFLWMLYLSMDYMKSVPLHNKSIVIKLSD